MIPSFQPPFIIKTTNNMTQTTEIGRLRPVLYAASQTQDWITLVRKTVAVVQVDVRVRKLAIMDGIAGFAVAARGVWVQALEFRPGFRAESFGVAFCA
jgi:hypothetical protein